MRGYGVGQFGLRPDCGEYGWKVVDHIGIREPKHAPSKGLNILLPEMVIGDLIISLMDRAIEFNDQAGFLAGEVCKVAAYGMLAAKLHAVEATATHGSPEQTLGAGLTLAKVAGMACPGFRCHRP